MIKTGLTLTGLLGLATLMPSEKPTPIPSIESKCSLIWKAEIGKTSFRTNVVFKGDRIWIGSNGDSFMDRGAIEPGSGVYELDRRTGKQVRHFANEIFGDMDVNGILYHRDRLYFGNDNEEFLCTDLQGKIRWRNPTSGDIEHEPSLLQTKNGAAIIYATEAGEVKAVNPDDGKILWSYYVREFDSWKPGDNRTVFKVRAWFSNTGFFYTRPLTVDVNADGVNDLIYRTYSGNLLALDGNSGSLIWSIKEDYGMSIGFTVLGRGKQKKIVALKSIETDTVQHEISFYSLKGQKLKSIAISDESWNGGLNAYSINEDQILLNSRTKTYRIDFNGSLTEIDRSMPFKYTSWDNELVDGYRNSGNALFADGFIPLSNNKKAIVVLNQQDNGDTNVGFLEILSVEDGRILDRLSVQSGGEMPPVIKDVDLDGDLDLLFAGYDGYIYCYQLPKY
jgi:outer membrane protein assembly factor BamB